jgi:hypothetical protein
MMVTAFVGQSAERAGAHRRKNVERITSTREIRVICKTSGK